MTENATKIMNDETSELESKFHEEMLGIYRATKELGLEYSPIVVNNMAATKGGLWATKRLISS